MAAAAQPVLDLPDGLRLRPRRPEDADALLAAGQDPAVRRWNRFIVADAGEARARIARMRERWRAETGAVRALARPDASAWAASTSRAAAPNSSTGCCPRPAAPASPSRRPAG